MSRETRVDHDYVYMFELLKNAGEKNHLPFSVLFLPPEIYILDFKNIVASNFFLLKNQITETVIYFGRNEIRFKFALFK